MGHQSPPEIHLRRRAPGQRRIPLPCIAQAGAGRLDQGRVEADRKQPKGEVLFAHPAGQETARIGGGELAAVIVRYLARCPAFGGLERPYADGALVVQGAHAAAVDSALAAGGAGAQ